MNDAGRAADHGLLEKFIEGDREAFTTIYRTHYPAVFRFSLYMTNDREAAREITQETFVWLVDHPATFDPQRGELPAFLSGVALKMVRRRERDGRRWRPLEEAPNAGPSRDAELDTTALRQAIALLREPYRGAVVLCGLEGKSYDEAAAILGCAVGTVRSRLHRARALLAAKLVTQASACALLRKESKTCFVTTG